MAFPTDLLDLIHESVVTCDASGVILSWNRASERLYGWPREEAIGRDIDTLLKTRHDDLPGSRRAVLDRGQWEGELGRSTARGEERVIDVRWALDPGSGAAAPRVIETARDVSRRKADEHALKRSEYRYRSMFEAMAVAFWEVDFTRVGQILIALRAQGITDLRTHLLAHRDLVRETMRAAHVIDLNPSGLALFGAEQREAIVGRTIADFWPDASEPVYVDSLVATMTRRPHFIAETQLKRLDGRLVDVLFTVSLSHDIRRQGVVLIGVVDVSARKQAEAALAKLQADFAHAARVSILGELTASIAHEVNQPLAAIATSASASLRWLASPEPDVDEVRSLSRRIAADALRASAIIARVRAMAERREPEHRPALLNALVREVVRFLDHEITAQGVAVSLHLDEAVAPIRMDRTQIQQVIVNLAVNAIQAMSGGVPRRLDISTSALADGSISLSVQDTGGGLPDDPSRLFEGFYTTKSSGLGMGLSICRRIVESHGGTITARNADRGACFTVTLPTPTNPLHRNIATT